MKIYTTKIAFRDISSRDGKENGVLIKYFKKEMEGGRAGGQGGRGAEGGGRERGREKQALSFLLLFKTKERTFYFRRERNRFGGP